MNLVSCFFKVIHYELKNVWKLLFKELMQL